jgi:hypothetical protein
LTRPGECTIIQTVRTGYAGVFLVRGYDYDIVTERSEPKPRSRRFIHDIVNLIYLNLRKQEVNQ